ncbi:two component transcriptional regulator, LuxR family [Dyadobacter sp. SG02]|uniref:response regulator n=1 Tax=Dyadobacter sp. SG02 TaxID=1855291 RepID=UPI0008CD2EE7|nr:response regulator transcription factor [Dyadobacter sp. SG02]SEJ57852.1 two component transcriptional regulator, LuxR family [Dyadobacter sp. SG02]
MKKILIADDHSLVRYGLKVALLNHFTDPQIDESWDGQTIMAQLKNNKYDLILLDLSMPDADTATILHWIKSFQPDAKVLVVSMNSEVIFGKRVLQMGAHGYIEKDASPEDLIKAVDTVLAGKKYMSADLADVIVNDTLNRKAVNPFDELTPREFQVAMYIIQDYTITQISELMQLQYTSVSTFRRRVFEKLNIPDRKALVQLAEAYKLS